MLSPCELDRCVYLQTAVVGCVQRHEELRVISDGHYKRLKRTIYNPRDIDFVARIMYAQHIMPSPRWSEVYYREFLDKHLVPDSPELTKLTDFISELGGWVKFRKTLKQYARRRMYRILQKHPRDDDMFKSGERLITKVDGLPADGRCH